MILTSTQSQLVVDRRPAWFLAVPLADGPAQLAAILCVGKVLAAFLGTVAMTFGHSGIAQLLVGFAMASDIADGIVFKSSRLATNSRWSDRRRIYDGLTDRFVVGCVAIPMVMTSAMPVPFFVLVVGREILTAYTNAIPFLRRGIVVRPNMSGRVGLLLIGIQTILLMGGLQIALAMYLAIFGFGARSISLYWRVCQEPRRDHMY